MALTPTLYRFRIELSDIDRGCYQSIDVRVAMHPSESQEFLMTRLLAYCLNWEEGLRFAPGGLSDTEEPALSVPREHGGYELWIEVGNPSAKRLHKASKASGRVRVYTYRNPQLVRDEIQSGGVHRGDEIEVFHFAPKFLQELARALAKDNSWNVVHNSGSLMVSVGERAIECELNGPH